MRAETIKPKDRDHWLKMKTKDVSSTESSALFGLNPYVTEFELWHRKKSGDVVEIEDNDVMKWGRRLEPAIAEGIAEDQEWVISPFKEYVRIPEIRMGSSFDFKIDHGGILEIKNVFGLAFKNSWTKNDDGTYEAPPHIEIQVQHQLAVSQYDYAYIAALVSGNKPILIRREPDQEMIKTIQEKIAGFWKSIDNDTPPEPDFKTDADYIKELYGYAEPGSEVDATNADELTDLAIRYKEASEEEKRASKEKEAVKAEMLTLIGTAEKIYGQGFKIHSKNTQPKWIEAYERKGYRNFRVTWEKQKDH